MFTITYALSLFFLLAVSSGVFFLSRRVKIPYTVLLAAVGVFLLVPLSHTPLFRFVSDFTLTPSLLFYLFLPVLIFESAYNINIRRFIENIRSISLLAVGSLLLSAALIGFGLTIALNLIGLKVPLVIGLLFGAIISATDPVAVLALFKEFGAPQRLALIFEGESIFNDGTAVALFAILLSIVEQGGFHGASTVLAGIGMFSTMMLGGAVVGLVMGGGFAKLVGYARENEFVSITLTIVLAHLTFITTELLSQHLSIAGFPIHLSAIIATTVASMVMGNYGRAKISPKAEEFVEKFWGQFAFLVNSLVFILIGLMFAGLPFSLRDFMLPVVVAIVVVALSRAISVYPLVALFNRTSSEPQIPRSWQHLLAWGSLRGALAITVVMLIPEDFIVPGWLYAYSPREFLLALTIGCVFTTLFLKATTIGFFMRKLRIDALSDLEELELSQARALIHTQALLRLNDFSAKGYMEQRVHQRLSEERTGKLERASSSHRLNKAEERALGDRILRLHAIGIERHYLKELYTYDEISERVYKRINGKLAIQYEHVDRGRSGAGDLSAFRDSKDVFEYAADVVRRVISPSSLAPTEEERYMYYRAQSIIARKVLKEFTRFSTLEGKLFSPEALHNTIELYKTFQTTTQHKMTEVAKANPDMAAALAERLARHGMLKVEEQTLENLREREMVSPKVYVTLRNELEESAYAKEQEAIPTPLREQRA